MFVHLPNDCLVGLMVKAYASRVTDLGSIPTSPNGSFSGSSHTSDLEIGSPVTALSGDCCNRVSICTGWSGVDVV